MITIEYILTTKAMRIPVCDLILSEVNLRVVEFDSDLNIKGLMEYRLPFAEKR